MKAWLLLHPSVTAIAVGALSGAVGAARADRAAFQSWKSWHDAFAYDWAIASFRWFQGAVLGALAASPIGYLLS
jgi:hypothetical protein